VVEGTFVALETAWTRPVFETGMGTHGTPSVSLQ
jgi:hypothetical protein